ncbi:DUF4397 domain-containing protein [Streptomyces sp. OF3]|uniref:DUF4397 domain-containing protein n=2 Tax=Streptomyces alkaliterrae TaxID=2213162 RepID=A0A5P0YYF1_9ACTN|nr:DUF4397 domain-containing protein [Streptomyces alkaliterrae]MBB1259897.1 DUF4397 domain-containing protein [Streptomyces alkaliterrae]MQS05313.1 DUF4397 domain-containing protein [Streptomyces alkaliterrae]
MRTVVATAAAIGTCSLALAVAPQAAAAEDDKAWVSVFHGVPGLTVDVYANGDELLPDFEPGTLTDPQEMASGSYDIKVFAAGDDPESDDPAIEKEIEVPAGANATVAAHLDADGEPQLTAFVNDVSDVDAGKSRLTVRHVAAAPEVDVRAGGQPVFEGLTNPNEETTEVDAGTVSADVVLAGTDDVAIGPADLDLKEGTTNIVYAWGSAEDENLALKVQTLEGMHSDPASVPAGGNGAAAATNSPDAWLAWSAAGVIALAGGVLVLRRRTAQRA